VDEHGVPQSAVATDDGLSRLIEAETRLAHDLAAAEAEAARLIGAAREAAGAEESRLQAWIDAEASRLARQIAGERDAEIARVAAAAERRCLLLQAVPDAVVDQLAAEVEAGLLSAEDRGPPR
jgi:hypothetical protein